MYYQGRCYELISTSHSEMISIRGSSRMLALRRCNRSTRGLLQLKAPLLSLLLVSLEYLFFPLVASKPAFFESREGFPETVMLVVLY